jgi:Domain of unknown function (DUF4129)
MNWMLLPPWTALAGAASAPDSDVIKRTAEEVLSRPEFQLKAERNSSVLLVYVLEQLQAFFDFLEALWTISPVLACVIVVVLVVAVVALIVHITYTARAAWVGESLAADLFSSRRGQLDPAQLERAAEEAAARHDYIGAVRLLFRAAVVRLDQRAGRTPRPGTTNREYLSRYRASTAIDALRQFVDVIDAKWYGYGECGADDYQRCRQAHGLIRGAAEASL